MRFHAEAGGVIFASQSPSVIGILLWCKTPQRGRSSSSEGNALADARDYESLHNESLHYDSTVGGRCTGPVKEILGAHGKHPLEFQAVLAKHNAIFYLQSIIPSTNSGPFLPFVCYLLCSAYHPSFSLYFTLHSSTQSTQLYATVVQNITSYLLLSLRN